MIEENATCVLFCSSQTAKELSIYKDIKDSLVITDLLTDKECYVVPQDEFLKWLKGE